MICGLCCPARRVKRAAIRDSLLPLQLTRNRTEWKKAESNGADILSDVYNANPTAMRLIFRNLLDYSCESNGRKLAVLADMKELGGAIH